MLASSGSGDEPTRPGRGMRIREMSCSQGYPSAEMMSSLTRPVRFFTLLFAALQFAVPAAVSIADGALARASRESRSHVEGIGDNQCTYSHSADCLLCRFLSTTLAEPDASAPAVIGTDIAHPLATRTVLRVASVQHGFDSRAPPALPV